MKFATVAATVALSSSLATNALADERQIIVLNLRGNASLSPWPEGTRAVIAELATSNDQVLVRPSSSTTFAALMIELENAAGEDETVGAVCVGKSGSVGIAYVWVNGGTGAIRVEDDMREGAVAEGAVALRVSELLHVRNLNLPSARKEKPREAPPPPATPEKPKGPPAFTTWLGLGAITSSDASGPAPMVSVGARVLFSPSFGLEAAASSGFGWLKVQTVAGSAEVSMQALTLHAILDPWADRPASLSFGLGGGIAYSSVLGQPTEGYAAHYDSTTVGLFSARIGGTLRGGNLSLVAYAEPGFFAPEVSLVASSREVATLGRPWFSGMIGLGFSP